MECLFPKFMKQPKSLWSATLTCFLPPSKRLFLKVFDVQFILPTPKSDVVTLHVQGKVMMISLPINSKQIKESAHSGQTALFHTFLRDACVLQLNAVRQMIVDYILRKIEERQRSFAVLEFLEKEKSSTLYIPIVPILSGQS